MNMDFSGWKIPSNEYAAIRSPPPLPVRFPSAMCDGPNFSIFLPTLVVYFNLDILMGVKWYLVSLICISLMTNGVQHIFICFAVICIFSLEKCPLKSIAHLKIKLIIFLIIELYEFFMYSGYKPLIRYMIGKNVPPLCFVFSRIICSTNVFSFDVI